MLTGVYAFHSASIAYLFFHSTSMIAKARIVQINMAVLHASIKHYKNKYIYKQQCMKL